MSILLEFKVFCKLDGFIVILKINWNRNDLKEIISFDSG